MPTELILAFGQCVLFTGVRKMTTHEQMEEFYYEDYDGIPRWVVETDEETKERLVSGLLSVDIYCNVADISIYWTDIRDGTKLCKCKNIYYPRELLKSGILDIYIQELSTFDSDEFECPPRVYFAKL